MILVDKGKLKFLKAGRTVTVDVQREHRKGRAYTVRLEGSKTTRLRCTVVDTFRMGPECWRLTIKHQHEEQPVYLAATMSRGDYTTDAHRAALAADGPIERADPAWLNREAKAAAERDDAVRRERAHLERIARRRGQNPSDVQVKWVRLPPASDDPGLIPLSRGHLRTDPEHGPR